MRYSDFAISFRVPRPNGTEIDVSSPTGAARGSLRVLPDLVETRRLLPGLWRDLAPQSLPTPIDLRHVGQELFSSVFNGDILTLFEESMATVDAGKGGLRIKLIFDPHPSADLLHRLPWEFLYWTERQAFPALSQFTPLVRQVLWPKSRAVAPISKLRVLVVAVSPPGLPLTIEDECEKIISALAPLPQVEVVKLLQPTIDGLRNALLREEINVLHFAGYAKYDPRSGEAGLFFAGDDAKPRTIRGDQLALLLGATAPGLRLVFLNACDTARTMGAGESNPFRSVSLALVASGISAVIGMQFPISDAAASAFGVLFYQRLAAGDSVDIALTEGRRAVYNREPDGMEWGTPVLFSSGSDGELFASTAAPAAAVRRLRVFLCHAAEDKGFVRKLYERLMLADCDVWLDEERILPGKPWESEITRALRNSDVVVVCLSKRAITKAGFVQKEIAVALDVLQQQPEGAIYLVPIKIEECTVPERLRHLHFVHIDDEKGYTQLLASLDQRRADLHL